jgi:la-related protein 1
MYLRRHMDSQGFVALDFIAAFNRVKTLTTDVELLKLVCQQSSHVQYRTGDDGRDRLRRREGWEQWVLSMDDRDESAQNEGPKELQVPPMPNPTGFDQSNPPQYPTMHTGYGHDVSYPKHNPFIPNDPRDATGAPTETLTNGAAPEGANGSAVSNGQPIEDSTKAVSADPDSLCDAQTERLTVVVCKQNKSMAASRPLPSRTFSNDSINSKSGGVDELNNVPNSHSQAPGAVSSHG